jgi:hypothetical protein
MRISEKQRIFMWTIVNVMGMLCEHCGNIMGMWKQNIYINHFCNMQSSNLVYYITNFHIGWQWNITKIIDYLLRVMWHIEKH